MILDQDLAFSQAQTIPTGATTASTNVVDLSAVCDIGVGEDMELVVTLTSALVGAGTVAVIIQTDDNVGFSSATTAQTIGTFAAASAAGTKFTVKIQPGAIVERYMRLSYTAGVLTGGAVSAYLAHGVDNTRFYADAITITG